MQLIGSENFNLAMGQQRQILKMSVIPHTLVLLCNVLDS